MKCLNLNDPKVANLASKYGEVMAAKILDYHGDMGFPDDNTAETLFQFLSANPIRLSITPSEDVSQLRKILLNPSNTASDSVSEDADKAMMLKAFMKNIDKNGNYRYKVNGKVYTIPSSSSLDMIKAEINRIYSEMSDWDTRLKDNALRFLANNDDPANAGNYFGRNQNGDSFISKEAIGQLKSLIDFVPADGDKIMRLSEVQNAFPEIKVDTDFIGHDPYIVVHKKKGDTIDVSIFDVTSKSLRPSERSLLFNRFMSTAKLKQMHITSLTTSEKGIRDFNLTLLAMSMRQANDKIRFRKLSTIQVSEKKSEQGIDIKLTESGVLKELSTFLATPEGAKFLETLSPKLQGLLNNKKLLRLDYGQSYLHLLENEFRRQVARGGLFSYEESSLNEAANKIADFVAGKGNLSDMNELLRRRDKQLKNIPDNEKSDFEKREAYMLAQTLRELNSAKVTSRNTVKDIKKAAVVLELPSNMQHDAVQHLVQTTRSANLKVVKSVNDFTAIHDELIEKKINNPYFARNPGNQYLSWGIDTSNQRFERLWRKVKAIDNATGKEVDVNSRMIHYNMNDPETKEAIRQGKLSADEVEYGKFIVETIKEQFIQALMHDIMENQQFTLTQNTQGRVAEARLKAENQYKNLWRDGMIPLMTKTVSAKMFSGDFRGGFSKLMKNLATSNAQLQEVYIKEEENTIENKFLWQMGSEVDDESGPQFNLGNIKEGYIPRMMGIEYNDKSKQWVLTDPKMNNDLSMDLELITKYMIMVTQRKIEYDKSVIPTLNDVKTILYQEGLPNTQEWVRLWSNRVIYGKSPKADINIPTPWGKSLNLDAALSASMQAATIGTMSLNIPVGLTSAAINSFTTLSSSIANQIGGTHLFGFKDMVKAVKIIAKGGFQKAEAINQMYGVTEETMNDKVENRKHQKSRRTIWNSKTMNWFNYIGDYFARMHVMVAQMVKDGSWDAHVYDEKTGKITYDEKLDKRFYKDGALTPQGKAIKQGILDGLIRDGQIDPAATVLNKGYDMKSANILKDVGDQIMFAIDPENTSNLSSYWLGKLWQQYKQYLNTKMGQLYSEGYDRHASGQYVAVLDEVTGEYKAEFKPEYFEGKYQTLVYALKELGTLKQKPTEFWVNLQPRQRANIVKLCTDVILASALYTMTNMMGLDDDDDEYKYQGRNIPMYRLRRMIANTNRDLLNDINPGFWIETLKQPVALVPIAEKYGTVMHGLMTANMNEITKAPLGIRSSVESLKEIIK